MTQLSLAQSGFELSPKTTRKRQFLDEMNQAVPWDDLVALIQPHAPAGKTGRPPFAVATLLRIHFMQQWFGLSDPAMEEALHDMPLYCQFAQLDPGTSRLPDETTILRFRHLLQTHNLAVALMATINQRLADKGLILKTGSVIDATLIAAPTSTKNKDGQRDPEMHQTKKGNQYYFGMKAHIGVDVDSGLVHSVVGTAANAHDITQAHALLHGQEQVVFADAGYRGVDKRDEVIQQHPAVQWEVAMMPSKRRALPKTTAIGKLKARIEKTKAQVRAKVEHPFRVVKRQFGYVKVRYRGLAKNTAQLVTLFALSNVWMVRRWLIDPAKEQARLKSV
jgi:transposase, IS5 family